jgi:hypothetical protein
MESRIQKLDHLGCDAVLPHHIDCYAYTACVGTHNPLDVYKTSLHYIRWLADVAHEKGMAFGLSGAPGMFVYFFCVSLRISHVFRIHNVCQHCVKRLVLCHRHG